MKRKFGALLLTFVLLVQMAPAFTIGASAAVAVTYNREIPPAAIFNADNGYDANYYASHATGWNEYNAVSKFTNAAYSNIAAQTLTYSMGVNATRTYRWNWENTQDTIYKIADSGGLYINASGTFNNNWHTHSAGFLHLGSQDVLSYTSMQLYGANDTLQSYSGLKFSSSRNPSMRYGNGNWSALHARDANGYVGARSFRLETYEPDISYNEGKDVCSCHTGSITSIVVSFLDAIGPTIKNISLDKDKAKPGDTVQIHVQYNEPIRFADDSPNHDDAIIKLRLDNHDSTVYRTANLIGLSGDTLTFLFTVPATDKTSDKIAEYSVSALDLSPLFIEGSKLVQIDGSGKSFEAGSNYKGDGYTTAKAIVTDLAGNSITQKTTSMTTLRVDGVTPTVKSVSHQAATNNATVKTALDKTDSAAANYIDYSDTHLGVGDSITFTANFSELLNLTAGAYTAATATTNLKKNGSAVTVSSTALTTIPATTTDAAYSALTFAPLNIEAGMTCDDSAGNIQITKIEFTSAPTDLCGNAYASSSLSEENKNAKLLDVTAPAVSTTISATDSKYTPMPETDGFYFPFTITSDPITSDPNELASINGSFVLEPSDGTGSGSAFEYKVTNLTDTPSSWTEGKIGSPCTFEQFAKQQYLHIRMKTGTTYDLTDPKLVFQPEDYAGNIGSTAFQLKWTKDTVAPTASAGTPTRALTDAENRSGTLTVPVTVSDHSGLNKIEYAWGDSAPTTDSGWTDSGANLAGNTTITANAAANISKENFSKQLWVRATDKQSNTLTQNLGVFSYDLSQVAYTLTPNTNYANKATLQLSDLATDGAVAALLKVPGDDAHPNNYYVRYFTGNYDNIFKDTYGGWKYMTVTKSGSNYTFTELTPDSTITDAYASIWNGSYSGKLTVTTIAGKAAAFTTTTAANTFVYPATAGDNVNPVSAADTVIIAAKSGAAVYGASFTSTLTPWNGLKGETAKFDPTNSSSYLYSTLAGSQFTATLQNNIVPDRGIGDLDLANSYLALYDGRSNNAPFLKIPLSSASISGNTVTFTLPNQNYPTNGYYVTVHLARPSGADDIRYNKEDADTAQVFFVDTTDPSTAVIAGVLIDNDTLSDYGTNGYALYGPVDANETLYYPASHMPQIYSQLMTFTLAGQTKVGSSNIFEYGSYYGGQRAIRAWNVTAGETEASTRAGWQILIDNGYIPSHGQNYPIKADYTITYVGDAAGAAKAAANELPLIANQDNVIAVQSMSDNGKLSSVSHYTVHPDNVQVSGTFSTTQDGNPGHVFNSGEVVFTPAAGQALAGTKFYFCDGNTTQNGLALRTEMTQELDGTYRCALPTGLKVFGKYKFCAIDQYDNYTLLDYESLRNPYATKFLDSGAPTVAAGTAAANADGSYTATYTVTDDTNLDTKPLTLQLGFDDTYAALLGLSAGSTYTVSLAKGGSWTLPAGETNAFGLTGVRVDGLTDTQVTVTVTGIAKYDTTKAEGTTYSITPSLAAADIFGNTGSAVSDGAVSMANTKPAATGWSFASAGDGTHGIHNMALTATFNVPVTIGKSWICQSPTGLSTTKTDEIPITNDGDHTIGFYDVFGTLWQQNVKLEKVFNDYGFDLTFSAEGNTKDPVTISASTLNTAYGTSNYDPYVQFFDDDFTTQLSHMAKTPGYDAESNGDVVIKFIGNAESKTVTDYTIVHITNIVSGAPTARLHYRFEDTAMVYHDGDELPASTTGKVTVWYTTGRTVTATNGATHVFDAAGSYTFTYTDEFGNAGSVTADLSNVKFTGGAPVWKDTNPPQLSVSIEAKRAGSYTWSENFGVSGAVINGGSAINTIGTALDKTGYTQGYNFAVTAADDSDCKLVVLNTAPTGTVDYKTISGSEIPGVTVSGGNIYVNKTITADFAVTVVDSAGNYSVFTIPKDSLKFDNTAPEVTVEWESATLYKRTAYLTVSDKDDGNNDTGGSYTVTAPGFTLVTAEGAHKGQYSYEFTSNTKKQIVVIDTAGNKTTKDVSVSDLDDSVPELTVEWTPCYVDSSGTRDTESPPRGPLNTDITAKIKSSKPIDKVDVLFTDKNGSMVSLANWVGAVADKPSVVLSDTDKTMITVTFPSSGIKLFVTVTAANGQQSFPLQLTLIPGVIDKTTLTVSSTETDVTRSSYHIPYAKTITLTPSKDSYSTDGTGTAGTVYNDQNPLKVTVYANGTYYYRFADAAGNTAISKVDITGIDDEAPTITTDATNNMELTSGSAKVKVTLNEPGTINTYATDGNNSYTLTFSENGYYVVAAYDPAGNVSFARISIGSIDRDAPTIVFDTPTVKLMQGSADAALSAALSTGYTVFDGANTLPANAVAYVSTGVDLTAPGLYGAAYTVTDAAGNTTTATRWVQIYSKDLPLVTVDGERADPDGLMMLKAVGSHRLAVTNLKPAAEPYKVYLRRGIWSAGQMKGSAVLTPDAGGGFTLDSAGYYTLYIVTQSRQTFRVLLYVEK